MKVVVGINTVNFGSTGNIMLGIGDVAESMGFCFYPAFANSKSNKTKTVNNRILIGTPVGHYLHSRLAYFSGNQGLGSIIDTLIFLKKLNDIKPDIIHLHNLHDNYINLPLLFSYIKIHNIPVVWTLHDCWSFTGQCPYFTQVKCDKWIEGCNHCTQYDRYPASRIDNTDKMWRRKKKWFNGVPNLTIVTPSSWLAELVKQSYLKNYPVRVINNGINLNIFKPISNDIRTKYDLQNKHIVLGLSLDWGERKGLDVFIELANRLDDDYKIILVGTNDSIDKQLPDNVLSIHKTYDQLELASLFSCADVFLNPTREDNFPTVNIEALACGTPVVTFDTGGSPEMIDNSCGVTIKHNDVDSLEKEIITICEGEPFNSCDCIKRARDNYDMNDKFYEYVTLYNEVLNEYKP